MWQELSDLRRSFIEERKLRNEESYRNAIHLFLYEILKLNENRIRKQVFMDMIQNHATPQVPQELKAYDLWKAFLYVQDAATEKKKLNLSLVRNIAARVMKHTGGKTITSVGEYDTSRGDFRLGEDYDEVYPLSDYRKIPEHLTTVCEDVNKRLDKLQGIQTVHLAADFMYEFAHIKPFGEGNLETGLLLMNYLQLYHSEPLIMIFAEDKVLFLQALKRGENNQTPQVFENFIAAQQIKWLKQAAYFGI